jgi:hypothetical protein
MAGARTGWGLEVQSLARHGEVNLKNRGGDPRAKSGSGLVPKQGATAVYLTID